MSKPDFKTNINGWTTSDLQAFVQNLLSMDRSSLPASLNFSTVTAENDIVANGVTLTGAPRVIRAFGRRRAGSVPLTDQTNNQVIATGTWTELNYVGGGSSRASYDSSAVVKSTSQWTSNSAWQAPATGIYVVTAHAIFDGNATGTRQIILTSTGQGANADQFPYTQAKFAADGTSPVMMSIAHLGFFTAGDTCAMYVFQNSGGNLDILCQTFLSSNTNFRDATMSIAYIGPQTI